MKPTMRERYSWFMANPDFKRARWWLDTPADKESAAWEVYRRKPEVAQLLQTWRRCTQLEALLRKYGLLAWPKVPAAGQDTWRMTLWWQPAGRGLGGLADGVVEIITSEYFNNPELTGQHRVALLFDPRQPGIEQYLVAALRSVQKQKRFKPADSRARFQDWLDAIVGYEDGEAHGGTKAPAFTKYRRILDGFTFTASG